MTNLDTCTLDECRDEVARLLGWERDMYEISHLEGLDSHDVTGPWYRNGVRRLASHHPVPLSLDWIAAAMERHAKGWRVRITNWEDPYEDGWGCESFHRDYPSLRVCSDSPTELGARLRCFAKVLRLVQSAKENPPCP